MKFYVFRNYFLKTKFIWSFETSCTSAREQNIKFVFLNLGSSQFCLLSFSLLRQSRKTSFLLEGWKFEWLNITSCLSNFIKKKKKCVKKWNSSEADENFKCSWLKFIHFLIQNLSPFPDALPSFFSCENNCFFLIYHVLHFFRIVTFLSLQNDHYYNEAAQSE